MKKAVFWDFDGTLSAPNKSFDSALYDTLLEFGFSPDYNSTTTLLHNSYSWNSQKGSCDTFDLWWQMLFLKINEYCLSLGVPENALSKLDNVFCEKLTDVENYSLYDDAIPALEKCITLGYDNFLLTNNYPEITENIEKLGIAKYFNGFIVSSHIGVEKPQKEIFAFAKNIAKNPDLIYMFGDNPYADIAGAHAAEITTVFVRNGYLKNADFCVDNLWGVDKILK